MKYFIANPVLDQQIKSIQKTLRLSMNGVVSDSMAEKGIRYKKNYGVSLPRLKEIAAIYEPNHDLAQRLWHLQIRETMLLACFLQPVDKFTLDMAKLWTSLFNQIEIIEIACMSLFSKLPFAEQLSLQLVDSNNEWERITAYILAARVAPLLSDSASEKIQANAINDARVDSFHLYKAIALVLSRLCRNNKADAKNILSKIEFLGMSDSVSCKFIYEEVKNEINFTFL